MGVREERKQIRGAEWGLNILSAERGLPVLTWLLDMMGEPAGRVFASALRGGLESLKSALTSFLQNAGEDALALAIGSLTRKLAEPQTIHMIRAVLYGLTRDKREVDFDSYFAGNYGELRDVLVWAVRVNFESFFDVNQSPAASAAGQVGTPPST